MPTTSAQLVMPPSLSISQKPRQEVAKREAGGPGGAASYKNAGLPRCVKGQARQRQQRQEVEVFLVVVRAVCDKNFFVTFRHS